MIAVFDYDDTVVATQPVYDKAKQVFKHILHCAGIDVDNIVQRLDELDRLRVTYRGLRPERFIESMAITYAILSARNEIPYDPAVDAAIHSLRHLLDVPPEPYPETTEVLKSLQERGHLLVLYSAAGDVEYQRRRIELSGIQGYFHHVVVTATKDSDSFLRLLERIDAIDNPQRVVAVGNSYRSDILPALQCGAKGVLIDRGDWQTPQQGEIDPNVPVLPSLEGLPELISQFSKGK
ncbi:hypothetical protein HRbin16_01693 [bacterium HR16]|nr:hypothetical protein HRbin16_01693 [bacterium HR16]